MPRGRGPIARRVLPALLSVLLSASSGCTGPGGSSDQSTLADLALAEDGGSPSSDGGTGYDLGPPPDLSPPATIIRVHYPAGTHAVTLRGSGGSLSWLNGVAMVKGADDTWSVAIDQAPAVLEFKPLLDDATWARGGNYLVRAGRTTDVYPHFYSTHGSVTLWKDPFHSTALSNNRKIWVYLPSSYYENTLARFPVLYMQDGGNLFDPTIAFGGNEWKVDEALDTAVEGSGSIREIIVVGVEATAGRLYEYSPTVDSGVGTGGGANLYLTMLLDELKPAVDTELRTLTGPEHTGLMGSSMGGLLSSYGGLEHAGDFGLIGALSPSTWWDDRVIVSRVSQSLGALVHPRRVYLDCGTNGDGQADTDLLAQAWEDIGYVHGDNLKYVVDNGGQHSEVYWAARLPGALEFLFGPGPERTP